MKVSPSYASSSRVQLNSRQPLKIQRTIVLECNISKVSRQVSGSEEDGNKHVFSGRCRGESFEHYHSLDVGDSSGR